MKFKSRAVLETSWNVKLTKGVLFRQDNAPAHNGLWLQWLLGVTVALNWLITLHS